MNTTSNKPPSDDLIVELHEIREQIVDEFDGDLAALTADAQRRQAASNRKIISRTRPSAKDVTHTK